MGKRPGSVFATTGRSLRRPVTWHGREHVGRLVLVAGNGHLPSAVACGIHLSMGKSPGSVFATRGGSLRRPVTWHGREHLGPLVLVAGNGRLKSVVACGIHLSMGKRPGSVFATRGGSLRRPVSSGVQMPPAASERLVVQHGPGRPILFSRNSQTRRLLQVYVFLTCCKGPD